MANLRFYQKRAATPVTTPIKSLCLTHLPLLWHSHNPEGNPKSIFTTPVKNRFSPRTAGRCEPERGVLDPAPLTRIIFDPMDHPSFGVSYHCPYFGVNRGNRGFHCLMAQHSATNK